MDQLRKQIINTIYERWCEKDFLQTKSSEGPETRNAINGIIKRFQAEGKDALYVESMIIATMCAREESAFKDGFYLCLELLNGNMKNSADDVYRELRRAIRRGTKADFCDIVGRPKNALPEESEETGSRCLYKSRYYNPMISYKRIWPNCLKILKVPTQFGSHL